MLYWAKVAGYAALLAALVYLFFRYVVRIIPNNRVGILEKRIASGSVKSGIIALGGEAGYQPDVMRGGIHPLLPFLWRVHEVSLVTVPQGQIGYVFARDGQSLQPGQTLGRTVESDNFRDVRAFLANGGQQGPQRQILREGTYAINLAQFAIITENCLYYLPISAEDEVTFRLMATQIEERQGFRPVVLTQDGVGIVTVHDGPTLLADHIVAPVVGEDAGVPQTYHNHFQDPDRFLAAGGKRGRQHQVMVEGTYYLNRLFATVELVPKTVVDVGYVGVVVSYIGDTGADVSGEAYRHGELVAVGLKGVWGKPLMPGKYAFNTYAGKVIVVPTTNFILKWVSREVGSHRFDENLQEVSLITKDAFEPSLPLSVVVHIDYQKAPLVIQRFGDIKKLVEQTLDPMVAAYFKNVGQTRTLIQLLQDRSSIQKLSCDEMKQKFAHYDLELEEVLIGTPTSSAGDKKIEDILIQLRSRQIAKEQVETYADQEKAAKKERELREAEALARQQANLTESELSIQIQSNQGKAQYQKSLQKAEEVRAMAQAEADKTRKFAEAEAEKTRWLGEAEADRVRRMGEAEADRVRRLGESEADRAARKGIAEAISIEEQVRAYGGPRYQLTLQVMSRMAEAIEKGGIDLVPRIVMGGTDGKGGSTSALEALMALTLADRMGDDSGGTLAPRSPEAEALRRELLGVVKNPPSEPAKVNGQFETVS